MVMYILRTITFAFILLLSQSAFAQEAAEGGSPKRDTVYMMNGQIVPTTILDTSFFGVKILRQGKKGKLGREVIIEGERVFSYKINGGEEVIIYQHDSLLGNEFTIHQTREFIIGERDAQKGYRTYTWPAVNAVIGFASSAYLYSVLSFAPPFAVGALSLAPRVSIDKSTVSNLNLLKSDPYLEGYGRVAEKRRTLKTLLSGVGGLAAGFIARSVYESVNGK